MSDWSNAGGPNPARSSAVNENESELWTFSLTVYSDPAVQKECLDLQDEFGIDVNLLLFCAFVGAVSGAVLSDEAMKEAADVVGAWHRDVVGRLRQARRALKPFATETSAIASPARSLRTAVKALELDAERIEQAMLEQWSAARIDAWPRARPAGAVVDNIQMLFAISAETPRRPPPPQHLVAAALTAAANS
jgi:uncharacterized protein (TIGR02444 family)